MSDPVNRLLALLKEADAIRRELEQLVERLQRDGEGMSPGQLRELIKNLTAQARQLLARQGDLLEEAQKLARELGTGEPPPPARPARPERIAQQFRTLIDRIQLEARQPKEGEIGATLKSLEIELKGLIVVEQDEAQIVTPAPGRAIDPGLLSTIKMSFGTIPLLRPAEEPPEQPG